MSLIVPLFVAGLGLLFVAIGLFGVFRPYTVARLKAQIDSIGSTRSWNEIELAGWMVSFTRATFPFFVIIGAYLLWVAFDIWQELS